MAGKIWDLEEEQDLNGPHLDDDGEPCDCMSTEVEEKNGEPTCPHCGAVNQFSLVHGDHGCRCDKCKETFCCP